jgi:hypothetical protein
MSVPPRPLGSGNVVEGGGSSWAFTRLNSKTGFRARELSRTRRALHRRTGKEWMSLSGFSPLSSNHDMTTAPLDCPRTAARLRNQCGRWGSSWAFTRLNPKIGLTGFRTRDLSRTKRVLHRRTGKEWISLSGFSPLNSNRDNVGHALPYRYPLSLGTYTYY